MIADNEKKRLGITAQTQLFDASGAVTAEYQSLEVYVGDQDHKTRALHYNQDGSVAVEELFDHRGLVSQALYFASDQVLGYQYRFKYDQSGKEIERAMLSADGTLHKKRVYVYNSEQQIEQALWYNKEGVIEVIDEYDYEYEQADTSVIITRGEVAQWTKHYDQQGHMLSSCGGYWSEDQHHQTQFQYDQAGRLIQEDQINGDSLIQSTTHYRYMNNAISAPERINE